VTPDTLRSQQIIAAAPRSDPRSCLQRLFLAALLGTASGSGLAFEIYALGTSATNCKGVDRDKIFPVRLQEILRADGFDATVVNGGQDGDLAIWMLRRLPAAIGPATRLVIVEPGPNGDRGSTVEYSEKILAWLRDHQLPAVYASSPRIQSREEAEATARKFDAWYYGHFPQGVPVDRVHWQFDVGQGGKGPGGHMTAEGCLLVAKKMAPLIERILVERNIR